MYRSKIEQTIKLKPKAIPISQLLSQILSHAVKFDKKKDTLNWLNYVRKFYFKV